MHPQNETSRGLTTNEFLDTMIRLGVIALLAVMCYRVFSPFASLMIWALVLAIALYPLHQTLAAKFGGRQGRAATLMVVIVLLLIGGPTIMLGGSFATEVHDLHAAYQNDELVLKHPDPKVANWPVIGEKVYMGWNAAADNLPAFVEQNRVAIDNFAKRGLAAAKNSATAILLFLAAFIVAGIMMAFGQSSIGTMRHIFCRFAGLDRGPTLQSLSIMTVRSVAAGVVGVAFIQAILLGIGFLFAGIPVPGVLAMVTLIVGIVQLPALIISLPAVAYLWMSGDASTTSNVVWTVYLLIAGMADNVLKPMLLGRGVDAPMPVILIGALGGMFAAGIIGLFVGAVVLALGYEIFMGWVHRDDVIDSSEQGAPASE